VLVHTVLVGTEQGQPVPDVDDSGARVGYKKDEEGNVVVSRAHPETLDAIARGTGGRSFRINGSDTSLAGLAAAIEGMEQKTLAREWSYRKKERYQVPLGVALSSLALALLLPLPPLRLRQRKRKPALAAILVLCASVVPLQAQDASPSPAPAPPHVVDELTLAPRRLTDKGRTEYGRGNHPEALSAFSRAATTRPGDPRAKFNLADGLYKNGKYDEAEALYRSLGTDPRSPVAPLARYNRGNALFQKQDYKGAIGAYRDALHLSPDDVDTRRNLELALRALQKQQEQQKQDQKDKQDQQQGQQGQQQAQNQPQPGGGGQQKSEEQKEQERFEKEAGMPKSRADQLLDALQQDEKGEQKKQLARKGGPRRSAKDW
jgi:Ca-activated chloride channel family protein